MAPLFLIQLESLVSQLNTVANQALRICTGASEPLQLVACKPSRLNHLYTYLEKN